METISYQEKASVLAGLKLLREMLERDGQDAGDNLPQFDDVLPLTPDRIDALYEKINSNELVLLEDKDKDIPFVLLDDSPDEKDDVVGAIDFKSNLGLALTFKGYGDCCSDDEYGTPLYIEVYNGELRALVFSDINSEQPTHVISLEGARLDKRLPE